MRHDSPTVVPHPSTEHERTQPTLALDPDDPKDRELIGPARGVHDESGRMHLFPRPRLHAVLMRARRLLLGLVVANMILAALGMIVLGPWGFIPAAPLVVLVPLFMVATDLDRRAMGARTEQEREALTLEEEVEHPEGRSTGRIVVEAIEHTEPYTPGEARAIALGLFLFASVVAILSFVAGLVFGRPLLGFGALFLFGYVALLGSVVAFAGLHELYEDEHGLHARQHQPEPGQESKAPGTSPAPSERSEPQRSGVQR